MILKVSRFVWIVCAITAALLGSSVAMAADRPNIVMIMCDDLGYSDVGYCGAPDIRTPEIDALAKAGTICTSGYVVHPFCGPSRMGLFTGRYPHAFGGQFNLAPSDLGIEEYNRLGIPESETMISTVLQKSGYRTGIVGKWHMGIDLPYHPNNRGFDDFYGFLAGGHNYFPDQYGPAYERQIKAGKTKYSIREYLHPLEHNGKPVSENEYLTDALSKQAVRFINESGDQSKPFFLFVSYNAPHSPMEAKEEDMAKYPNITNKKRRVVAGMVTAVDRGVGLVKDALKENGQLDNTLIVFLSDNGGKPQLGSSNAPFRGTKGDTWEGGFRIPMFFHWPGHMPAETFDHPVTALDFYPTFAKLAGAEIPSGKVLDGKDISAHLKEGTDPRDGSMIFAMRHRGSYSDVGVRDDKWKLVRFANEPWRLFDITKDQSETHDVASEHPEQVSEMIEAAQKWSQTHTTPQWFHALPARDMWNDNDMPKFKKTFQPVTGAPELRPVVHITDAPSDSAASSDSAAPSAENPPITQNSPAKSSVKRKKGESTKAEFIAREKQKWENKGWPWDQAKVEANFDKIDTNGDGLATIAEKKAYWEAKKNK